jgi:hypothetical protein
MDMKKDPEFKKMIGIRKRNSDGFSYVYGSVKDGSTVRPASALTKRQIRDDKRSVKSKTMIRIFEEIE